MNNRWLPISLNLRIRALRVCQRLGLRPREVYYIGSNEVLPPPLEAEEESKLLRKLEDGDSGVKEFSSNVTFVLSYT